VLIFIVAGLTSGSIYALAAVGLVLTYKTSGIFNFAQGALASASAFLFYFLYDQHGIPWPIAALICVGLGGPVVGFFLEWVTRNLARGNVATRILATVGLLLAIEGGLELVFPPGPDREVTQFLPSRVFDIFGAPVAAYQIIIFVFGAAAVLGLTAYLRYTSSGLAMRAVVDNTELLDVFGIPPARVRRQAWVIGSMLAAASGVLFAPLIPLDATALTLLVITAFGAAAVGAFSSLPITYVGGLAIGVGEALLQKYFVSSTGLTGGLSASLPFLILFVLLIAAPRLKRPSALALRVSRPNQWQPPTRIRLSAGVVVAAVLIFVPSFAGLHLIYWTSALAYVILFLSLGLLVKLSGQVSLASVSFMAVGVAAFSHVTVDHHWPWVLALLFAGAVAAPIGAVLAIPAIRFPGLYLALATLGFGLVLEQMFYNQSYMFGTLSEGLTIPRPYLSWLDVSSNDGYYYLVLTIAALVALLVMVLTRSRLGRLLRAMSDSSTGLRSCGTSINVCRVLVFCLSASLAAMAGVLDGGSIGLVGSSGYAPLESLQIFAVLMLTVGGAPMYAIVAAAGQVLIPSYISTSETVQYAFTAWFGVSAIFISIRPPTMPDWARRRLEKLGSAQKVTSAPPAAAPESVEPTPTPALKESGTVEFLPSLSTAGPKTRQLPAEDQLAVEELIVRFGGVSAVDGLSLIGKAGTIVGLIGPNGAGKTTVFNACSGLVRPASGAISLNGKSINRLGPPARARRGLGRTFQQIELFDSMTTMENVSLGCEASYAAWNPLDHLVATRHQMATVRDRCNQAMSLCGIWDIADTKVGELSTGQRRLVELARCVAGDYVILLLDEPSSGLDRHETEKFGEILRRVVAERSFGIILVEHDMSLVNSICEYVYVMDFGRQIFEGGVGELLTSSVVREAYLGTADGDGPSMATTEAGLSST
jgi:ABC-type branched-subunit amino acid transport system ATPase component/branched-subunit amino acid ABC-type transport system permease component